MNSAAVNSAGPYRVAEYRVEPSLLRVTGEAGEVRLEARVMQVLVYLVEHAGQVVSRAELEAGIWSGRVVTEDAVTNSILKLRRAFGDSARDSRVIETIPKTGYRLIAEVAPLGEDLDRVPSATPSSPLEPPRTGHWPRIAAIALTVLAVLLGYWAILFDDEPSAGRTLPQPGKPAVAVLPFENLGDSPEQDYFADGITADLITDLSKASGLLVIAPGSVFAYKGSQAAPGQVSAELAVDYLIVGSVQRSGERLRVNVQLIAASDQHALWAERYEGVPGDIFTMQDQLTAAVISALQIELAPSEQEVLARRPTASVAAYDDYLRGIEAHGRRTSEQNLLAREHFQRAIELDPGFARAYAGLALTHSRDAIDGWVSTPLRSLEQAAELAARAAAIDPALPQVHFVSGQVDLFRRRHVEAIAAAQRALQVDPNYADAHALSAWILNYAGRTNEAQRSIDQAMRLNPRATASYLEIEGEIRFVQRRFEDSAAVFAQVLAINPNYMRARMWNAAALALAGDVDQAEWEATELRVLNPEFSLQRLAFAFPFKDPTGVGCLDGRPAAGGSVGLGRMALASNIRHPV